MDIFALFVLLVIICAAIWLLILIGNYPGKYAQQVDHPQVDAINCLAWVGLFTLGILWLAALVWSRVTYPETVIKREQSMTEEVKS
jgi:hypothetical protein